MSKFNDSLRGYASEILMRDGYRCRYCGLDGSKSFDNWLALSWDHLLPKGDPRRDDPGFIVACCNFCNTADNRYFAKAASDGFCFSDLEQADLVQRRLKTIERTRTMYREFWESNVRDSDAKPPEK